MPGFIRIALLALLAATLYAPLKHELNILGVLRSPTAFIAKDQEFYKIADTVHCEDLHYYDGKIFTACEDSSETRFGWFPPLVTFTQLPKSAGSIHVIDPKTMKSTRLQFENFARPFVTHGIDITPDPNDKDGAVYIFAVNHMPNPDFYDDDAPSSYAEDNDVPRARSQIELFHHVLGSKTVKHVRSIQHPMIKTPNDIYAASPASFYVTNDHFYRGGLQRSIEDVLPAAKWSNIVHVQVDDLVVADEGEEASSSGIRVSEALTGLHNNNGFGHGEHSDEMLIVSAMSGILYRAKSSNHSISVLDSIPLDSMGDNPSYFRDLYATPAEDKSGYLVAGLARPVDLVKNFADPTARDGVVVWYVRRGAAGGWEKRLIFEDDGSTIRTASAAVLVGIEPRANEKKKAWLFVTGFISESVVAVQVEL